MSFCCRSKVKRWTWPEHSGNFLVTSNKSEGQERHAILLLSKGTHSFPWECPLLLFSIPSNKLMPDTSSNIPEIFLAWLQESGLKVGGICDCLRIVAGLCPVTTSPKNKKTKNSVLFLNENYWIFKSIFILLYYLVSYISSPGFHTSGIFLS